MIPEGERYICFVGEDAQSLVSMISNNKGDIHLLIGPEGGFTDAEVADARSHGITSVHLGKRVLRAETASIAAVTLATSLEE